MPSQFAGMQKGTHATGRSRGDPNNSNSHSNVFRAKLNMVIWVSLEFFLFFFFSTALPVFTGHLQCENALRERIKRFVYVYIYYIHIL